MLSLTHASAGALAGEFIPNPYVAFLVGIVLHFIMDKIPHFWPAGRVGKGIVIVLDNIFSILFLLGLYAFPETRNASIIAGALGGVSVDFYFVILMRTRGKWAEWHTNRQPHRTAPVWFLTDVVLFAGLTVLLWVAVR